jgi:hypothetical protein
VKVKYLLLNWISSSGEAPEAILLLLVIEKEAGFAVEVPDQICKPPKRSLVMELLPCVFQ